jgi:hypothetical protein
MTFEKKIILALHILLFKVMFASKKCSCLHGKEILVAFNDMQQENRIYPNMALTSFAPLLKC